MGTPWSVPMSKMPSKGECLEQRGGEGRDRLAAVRNEGSQAWTTAQNGIVRRDAGFVLFVGYVSFHKHQPREPEPLFLRSATMFVRA